MPGEVCALIVSPVPCVFHCLFFPNINFLWNAECQKALNKVLPGKRNLIKLSAAVFHISFPIITNYQNTKTLVYKNPSWLSELGMDKT